MKMRFWRLFTYITEPKLDYNIDIIFWTAIVFIVAVLLAITPALIIAIAFEDNMTGNALHKIKTAEEVLKQSRVLFEAGFSTLGFI